MREGSRNWPGESRWDMVGGASAGLGGGRARGHRRASCQPSLTWDVVPRLPASWPLRGSLWTELGQRARGAAGVVAPRY